MSDKPTIPTNPTSPAHTAKPSSASSTDRLLARYIHGPAGPSPSEPASDSEGSEDFGCFGWLRGPKERAVMLELRKKTGEITAIGYSWIERIDYDPSEGITIHALGKQYTITGQHLNSETRPGVSLLGGLCRHRVPWVTEARSDLSSPPTGAIVEAIVNAC